MIARRPLVHAPAAEHLRRLAQVGDRPVRAVADVDLVDPSPGRLVERARRSPASAAARRAAAAGRGRCGRVRSKLGPGVGPLRRPAAARSCPRGTRRRSRRPGRSPVSEPASTAMLATASRSSIDSASAPSPTNSSAMFVPPATPISAITARIRSLPVTNGPLLARELDPDRARHRLPEHAGRQARGDVGRAEPGAEGAERPVGARVRVAAGDHRAGDDPALLDEDGVLDAPAALLVVGDALRVGPVAEQLLQLGRARVLGGDEVVGDDDDLGRVEHARRRPSSPWPGTPSARRCRSSSRRHSAPSRSPRGRPRPRPSGRGGSSRRACMPRATARGYYRSSARVNAPVPEPPSTADLADAAGTPVAMDHRIGPMWRGARVSGPAFTVRTPPGEHRAVREAAEQAPARAVIVIDGAGRRAGAVGRQDVEARARPGRGRHRRRRRRARRRRDEALRFPVFAAARSPTPPLRDRPGEVGVPVSCGGVTVRPGDLVSGTPTAWSSCPGAAGRRLDRLRAEEQA